MEHHVRMKERELLLILIILKIHSRETKIMPLYDFKCEECGKLVEDEYFKIVDDKHIKCCDIQMKQVILKAPGGIKPRERVVHTKGGIYMKDVKSGSLRKVGDPPTVGK